MQVEMSAKTSSDLASWITAVTWACASKWALRKARNRESSLALRIEEEED
jgi:hypothetical protein